MSEPSNGDFGDGDGGNRGLFGRRMVRGGRERLQPRMAPQPPRRAPRRRSGWLAVLSGGMTLMVLLFVGAGFLAAMGRAEFGAPGPLAEDKAIVIERGASTEEIVDLLDKEGVINRPTWFWAGLVFGEVTGQTRAKAGEYLFKRQASLREVMDTIVSGRAIQHAITIPEGLTSEQIVARMMDNDVLTGEVTNVPAEGTILPDTYKIERGTTRDQMVQRMQREHRRVLDEVWKKRAKDLPIRTSSDLVILASIVEKETGRPDERSRVAGVFVNRLGKSMKLQSDPTTIYGLAGGRGTLGRGLTRADLDTPTPYNTYVIPGLPPGPIANPGRAALEAAANPSRTKDLFFVADGTGGHAFAETLEQHNRNVLRWRAIEAQARAEADQQRAPAGGFAAPAPSGPTPPGGRTDAGGGADVANRAAAFAAPGTAIEAIAPAPGARQQGRTRPVIDASSDPKFDPLRNKSYDLNTPKTVPALR